MDNSAVKVTDQNVYQNTFNEFKNGTNRVKADLIEALIDADNVKSVVSYLATVCRDKSEHVSSVYDDKALAKAWTRAAEMLEVCGNRLPNNAGIGYGS